jgi:hypothetical protein
MDSERTKSSLPRHFPPPWAVKELPACFLVEDSDGHAIVHVHFEDESGRRSMFVTRDEARRIAANVAKLPELVRKPRPSR